MCLILKYMKLLSPQDKEMIFLTGPNGSNSFIVVLEKNPELAHLIFDAAWEVLSLRRYILNVKQNNPNKETLLFIAAKKSVNGTTSLVNKIREDKELNKLKKIHIFSASDIDDQNILEVSICQPENFKTIFNFVMELSFDLVNALLTQSVLNKVSANAEIRAFLNEKIDSLPEESSYKKELKEMLNPAARSSPSSLSNLSLFAAQDDPMNGNTEPLIVEKGKRKREDEPETPENGNFKKPCDARTLNSSSRGLSG
jgi:hypothetical protein